MEIPSAKVLCRFTRSDEHELYFALPSSLYSGQSKFEQLVLELCENRDLILNPQGPKSKLRLQCFPVPYSLCSWHTDKHTNQANFGQLHIGCSGVTVCLLGLFAEHLLSHSSQTSKCSTPASSQQIPQSLWRW